MRFRTTRVTAAAAALAGMMAAYAGSAAAEPGPTPWTYKQVPFQAQGETVDRMVSATQMTKDLEGPARAFTGPTSMVVNPENPRQVVAATADLRSRICYLTVSRDAGRTWHFSEELPTDPAYPWCTNTTAGVPEAVAVGHVGVVEGAVGRATRAPSSPAPRTWARRGRRPSSATTGARREPPPRR